MRIILLSAALLLCACDGGGSQTESQQPTTPQKLDPEPAGPIVFIGDSITARWNLQALVPGALNAGIGGQRSCEMLARFDADVLSRSPAVVVILAGINDISLEADPSPRCIDEMVQKALAARAIPLVGTLLPDDSWAGSKAIASDADGRAAVDRFNAELRAAASSYGYTLIDYAAAFADVTDTKVSALFVDGVHPSAQGYERMWSTLKPVLDHAK